MVSATGGKFVLRKKEFRNLTQCKELTKADPESTHEIDLSFNALE